MEITSGQYPASMTRMPLPAQPAAAHLPADDATAQRAKAIAAAQREAALAPLKARVIRVASRIGENSADTNEQRAVLRIEGARIPDFAHFQAWCAEGMRAAWQYDRDHAVYSPHLETIVTISYAARNTLRSWKRLARHFVTHHGIDEDIKIRDLDHRGQYTCELVPRPEREQGWHQWASGGNQSGLTKPMLERLRAQEAARKAALKAAKTERAAAKSKSMDAAPKVQV